MQPEEPNQMCDSHIRVATTPANGYTQTCLFGKRKIQQRVEVFHPSITSPLQS